MRLYTSIRWLVVSFRSEPVPSRRVQSTQLRLFGLEFDSCRSLVTAVEMEQYSSRNGINCENVFLKAPPYSSTSSGAAVPGANWYRGMERGVSDRAFRRHVSPRGAQGERTGKMATWSEKRSRLSDGEVGCPEPFKLKSFKKELTGRDVRRITRSRTVGNYGVKCENGLRWLAAGYVPAGCR
jgi:hypothetical protein